MPQKHAKNNCASKCFNHWERNEAASDGHYGTRKVRLLQLVVRSVSSLSWLLLHIYKLLFKTKCPFCAARASRWRFERWDGRRLQSLFDRLIVVYVCCEQGYSWGVLSLIWKVKTCGIISWDAFALYTCNVAYNVDPRISTPLGVLNIEYHTCGASGCRC